MANVAGPISPQQVVPTLTPIAPSVPATAGADPYNVSAFQAGHDLIAQTPSPVLHPAIQQFVASALKGAPPIRPFSAAGGRAVGNPGIAKDALQYVGTPYVFGGAAPGGFDCSGLLQYAAAQSGVHIGRTTYQQFQEGKSVGLRQLRPGDAVFFRGDDSVNGLPGHVGIYIGHGQFVEAAHTGTNVRVSRLAGYPGYMGARRY